MKLLMMTSIVIFGFIGSWLGGLLDHGNLFGGWSILFSAIGSFVGIWVGYKAGRAWLG